MRRCLGVVVLAPRLVSERAEISSPNGAVSHSPNELLARIDSAIARQTGAGLARRHVALMPCATYNGTSGEPRSFRIRLSRTSSLLTWAIASINSRQCGGVAKQRAGDSQLRAVQFEQGAFTVLTGRDRGRFAIDRTRASRECVARRFPGWPEEKDIALMPPRCTVSRPHRLRMSTP